MSLKLDLLCTSIIWDPDKDTDSGAPALHACSEVGPGESGPLARCPGDSGAGGPSCGTAAGKSWGEQH